MRAFRGPTSSWAARAGSTRPTASAMARSLAPQLRLGLFARPEREREKRGAGARACARARSSRVKVAAGSGATGGGFETLGLRTDLAARLRDLGVFKPTPIQSAAIPTLSLSAAPSYAIESYTGSGKTLAYLLPIVQRLLDQQEQEGPKQFKSSRGIRALVVVPSQELAMQIFRVAQAVLGDDNRNMVCQCIGGANKRRQVAAMKANMPKIVVGTPGRLADLSKSGNLQTHSCKDLVLDEADKLLQPTYAGDMELLLRHCGKKCDGHRRVLCSATMSKQSAKVFEAKGWVTGGGQHLSVSSGAAGEEEASPRGSDIAEAEDVVADSRSSSPPSPRTPLPELSPNLDHCFVPSRRDRKADTCRRCINALSASKVIVFHNFGNQLAQTAAKLQTGTITTAVLTSKMDKERKRDVIRKFSDGKVRVLVASEAATRGLDFPGCDLVVNMDLPMDAEHYVHRAGRTGRGGAEGVVVTLPHGKEVHVVRKYAKQLGIQVPEYEVVAGKMESKAKAEAEARSDPSRS